MNLYAVYRARAERVQREFFEPNLRDFQNL